jgi:hypothetical protein
MVFFEYCWVNKSESLALMLDCSWYSDSFVASFTLVYSIGFNRLISISFLLRSEIFLDKFYFKTDAAFRS